MFPTFDVPPQHAETVGARKARKAKEEETARRSSTSTSVSSGSTRSAKANSSKSRSAEKSGLGGWFGKSSKKGVQEISTLPSLTKSKLSKQPEPEIRELEPFPRTAPLAPSPEPSYEQELSRRPSNRSNYESPSPDHFPPPPSRSLPPLPQTPQSGGLLSPVSIPGT